MKALFIIMMLFQPLFFWGQNAFVKKIINKNKAHLVIGVKSGDSINWYFAGCSFKNITLLPDTTKMRLIDDLLSHTSDTVMSDNQMYNLSGRYTVTRRTPLSKEYNLQIDALVLINYIAFSTNAFMYSPYPLLFDKENGKEICCSSKDLDAIISIYKDWFRKLKKKGFSGYGYPLYSTKYEWFASKVKRQKFNKYPSWDNYYDCKEIE